MLNTSSTRHHLWYLVPGTREYSTVHILPTEREFCVRGPCVNSWDLSVVHYVPGTYYRTLFLFLDHVPGAFIMYRFYRALVLVLAGTWYLLIDIRDAPR